MAIMSFLTILGVDAPVMTNWIGKIMLSLFNGIGNFGWTVVVFAIILKLVLSPIDVWQRVSMRKQQKKMEVLKPKLEKIQKQYANRPDILKQKQYELQRGQSLNALASCLPMIVSMVVFFIVFAGFRALVVYQNQLIVYNLNNLYIDNIAKVASGEMSMTTLNGML
ncbi:MAG: YidC/Oxa1 family membrane protein insertase, partial [Clostridia bacterium]